MHRHAVERALLDDPTRALTPRGAQRHHRGMALSDKVVLTCAVTGVLARREQCAGIPYTPAEIADECRRAYDAGAAVVHVHARSDDGSPTLSPEVFARIRDEVRARCPVLLNFSTGALGEEVSAQVAMLERTRPDIAALNMGTMNYAKYSKSRKQFVFDMVFDNRYAKIQTLLRAMRAAGVKPELECFDVGHTHGAWPLLDMGLLRAPVQFSFIVDVLGGLPATVESLQLQRQVMRELFPEGAAWEVIGISHAHWRMLASALVLGGNIRTGLEDHFYLPDGTMASSNGELVEKAAALCRLVGREPASVDEARVLLELDRVEPAPPSEAP